MLSKLGKLAAAIIIAGGATLLRSEPAAAATRVDYCSAEQESAACSAAGSYWWYADGMYYCGHYNGVCSTDGEYIYFGIAYDVQEDPCPGVMPC